MTVKDIVEKFLKDNGYDGLISDRYKCFCVFNPKGSECNFMSCQNFSNRFQINIHNCTAFRHEDNIEEEMEIRFV